MVWTRSVRQETIITKGYYASMVAIHVRLAKYAIPWKSPFTSQCAIF